VLKKQGFMKRIYFDYAAGTPIDPKVKTAMAPYFSSKFGNPGSLHSFGQEAMAAVDLSREKIAKVVGADFREIIFTGSATEANNLALRGVVKIFGSPRALAFRNQNNFSPAEKFSFPSARHSRHTAVDQAGAPAGYSSKQIALNQKFLPLRIIVSTIEHESILETAEDLESEGVEVIYLPVDKNGIVDLKKLKESLNERTILVSVMCANNEIGVIQPIMEILKIIRNFRDSNSLFPLFHTDAVQAFQYLDCNVLKLGVDFMTLSAHKIYGPKGIGALYVRRSLQANFYKLKTIITGGGQEFGLRSGTENVPAIVGFAKAVELTDQLRKKESRRIAELSGYFWRELKKIYPKVELNPNRNLQTTNYLPNILNISFPGHSAEDLLIKFDMAGIAVSAGSACSVRSAKTSHVLQALGLPIERIKSSIRFSFGKFTTKKEVNESIKRIRRIFIS